MVSPRTRKPAAERRSAVLFAASELFATRGFEATTVDEIAMRAGMAKGTVYLFFPSKAAIADVLRVEMVSETTAWLESRPLPATRAAWPEFLTALVGGALRRFRESASLHHGLVNMPHEHDGPLAKAFAELHSAIAYVIGRGIAVGALYEQDPAATSQLFHILLHAIGSQPLNLKEDEAFVSLLVRGLCRAPGDS